MGLLIFYVPCPHAESAQELVSHLLSKRLIACGNIIPSNSIYFWEGSYSNENEWIAILKSVSELSDILETSIKEIHPYDTPAIVSWHANCNIEYLEWVKSQLFKV